RQRERETVGLERKLGVASREPFGPRFEELDRWHRWSLVAQCRCEVTRAREILVRVPDGVLPHRDDRHFLGVLAEKSHGRRRDHEASQHDRVRATRSDDALRPRARTLYDAPAAEVDALDGGRRVADIESRDRTAIDLAGEKESRIRALHRGRLLVIVDEHDLASTGR